MYFLFYAQAFDYAMKSENLKILKFDFLENKNSFWIEIKNIFLVCQMFSFRFKKRNNKNVADTTFPEHLQTIVSDNSQLQKVLMDFKIISDILNQVKVCHKSLVSFWFLHY